jgi:hypothetical protein
MSLLAYGLLVCSYRGYHEYVRHGAAVNTAGPTLWGPSYCQVCGQPQEDSVPIVICGHCNQTTDGSHEWNCPLNPTNKTPQPTGWVCAKCGASNAPSVERFACSPGEPVTQKKILLG